VIFCTTNRCYLFIDSYQNRCEYDDIIHDGLVSIWGVEGLVFRVNSCDLLGPLSKEYTGTYKLLDDSDPDRAPIYALEVDNYETEQLLDEVRALIGS